MRQKTFNAEDAESAERARLVRDDIGVGWM